MVATAAVIGGVFLLTLLIVSIITVRISDMILDSRIGALDRTLGFLFGLGRGLVIVVVAFVFFAWLVPAGKQPEGVRNAKSRVVLENTGEWLQALSAAGHGELSFAVVEEAEADDQDQRRRTRPDSVPTRARRMSPARSGSTAGYQRSDRTDMRQLIDATRR